MRCRGKEILIKLTPVFAGVSIIGSRYELLHDFFLGLATGLAVVGAIAMLLDRKERFNS